MASINEMRKLRRQCEAQMTELLPQLLELKENITKFYETMRWEKIEGCTEDQYADLYDGFIYPYEEGRVDEALEMVCTFFDQTRRRNEI